jgi:hypothetical protein
LLIVQDADCSNILKSLLNNLWIKRRQLLHTQDEVTRVTGIQFTAVGENSPLKGESFSVVLTFAPEYTTVLGSIAECYDLIFDWHQIGLDYKPNLVPFLRHTICDVMLVDGEHDIALCRHVDHGTLAEGE